MNFFNRAIKNITRKCSKSVLLAITFFVIGNFVIVGLGVSNAADQAKILTRQKMRAVVTYEMDYQAFYDSVEDLEPEEQEEAYKNQNTNITQDEVNMLLSDERVRVMNSTEINMGYPIGFEAIPLNNEAENNQGSSMTTSCTVMDDGTEICEEQEYVEPSIRFITNMMPNMIEFEDNMYVLEEGRMYTQEDIDNHNPVCLITNTLAEHNNIRIGDTITVSNMSPNEFDYGYYQEMGITSEDVDINLEVEVIGIFDNMEEVNPNADNFDWMSKFESPENIVLMPTSTYMNHQLDFSQKMWDVRKENFPDDEYYQNEENRPTLENMSGLSRLVLLLNDPLEVDDFVEEYTAKTEGQFRIIDADNETFKELSKPLDTISMFADFIVWLVIINAVIIITLVTALTLKTREFEIGVFLAQGVTKMKIVAQFFVELAIVAIIGFTLSVVSGSMIASQVGEQILSYQIATNDTGEEEDDWYYESVWDSNYFTDITVEDLIAEYEVEISPLIIGEIYIAGLGIVLISILIPSFMVMRFNPKRILMSAQ